ncbi:SRPBCC family protein [Phycicoccus flavus]|uniref:SRPBCC family protein n=1 Tax=Phycicoccus flavus TaxID=2502783 RepID=UPI000FEBE1DF|nr:SRPBCC family protein [Phycicoccus flavus]NHA66559.1 polyketide cyclase [Phycicoccus flavus]
MDDDKKITVSRTIDSSAAEVFDVLTLPANHVELDGSGFVVSDEHNDRITGTGQVFTMNMTGDHMGGDYKTDNHVVGYEPNKLVAWKTAPAGTEPPGWQWVWELEPQGPDSTLVSVTYDWAQVTDPELLQKVSFPLVSQSQLEDTLAKLAATTG